MRRAEAVCPEPAVARHSGRDEEWASFLVERRGAQVAPTEAAGLGAGRR